MTDSKYSELPAVTTPTSTNEFGVNESGVSKKLTIAQVQGGTVEGAIPFVSSTGVFTQDTSKIFYDGVSTRLGVGTNAPEGTIHISTGASSSVSPTSQAKDFIVQSEGDAGITLFSPDANVSSIVFGSPGGTGNEGARLRWSNTNNLLSIATTETGADIIIAPGFLSESARFKSNGETEFSGNIVPDSNDSRDLGSSSARWQNLYIGSISFLGGTTIVGDQLIEPSSVLTVNSTTQGFLPPRMTTTERDAILSPTGGLMIYNTTTNKLNVFTTIWEQITSS